MAPTGHQYPILHWKQNYCPTSLEYEPSAQGMHYRESLAPYIN